MVSCCDAGSFACYTTPLWSHVLINGNSTKKTIVQYFKEIFFDELISLGSISIFESLPGTHILLLVQTDLFFHIHIFSCLGIELNWIAWCFLCLLLVRHKLCQKKSLVTKAPFVLFAFLLYKEMLYMFILVWGMKNNALCLLINFQMCKKNKRTPETSRCVYKTKKPWCSNTAIWLTGRDGFSYESRRFIFMSSTKLHLSHRLHRIVSALFSSQTRDYLGSYNRTALSLNSSIWLHSVNNEENISYFRYDWEWETDYVLKSHQIDRLIRCWWWLFIAIYWALLGEHFSNNSFLEALHVTNWFF